MEKVILLTGGNLGDRREYLEHAVFFLAQYAGNILLRSAFYETEPWGFKADRSFLNQAIVLETEFSPQDLLREIQRIEHLLGRRRRDTRYGSRTLDIDIIFYGEQVIREPDLEIPHPRMTERLFVLMPVNEISPEWLHPVLKMPVRHLLEQCGDTHRVKRLIFEE